MDRSVRGFKQLLKADPEATRERLDVPGYKVLRVEKRGTGIAVEIPLLLRAERGKVRVASAKLGLPEDAKPAMPSGLKQLDQPGQWVYVPAGEAHFGMGVAGGIAGGRGDAGLVAVAHAAQPHHGRLPRVGDAEVGV